MRPVCKMALRAVFLGIMTEPVDAATPKGIFGSGAVAYHAGGFACVVVFAGDSERCSGVARSIGRVVAARPDRPDSGTACAELNVAARLYLGRPVFDTASTAHSADFDRA